MKLHMFCLDHTPDKQYLGHIFEHCQRVIWALRPILLNLHTLWNRPAHPSLHCLEQQKICTPYAARVCICIGITSSFHFMIIRTLSSKWETGSDLSFVLRISYKRRRQAGRHPDEMSPRLLSFFLLSFLPFSELPLPFLALKEFLNLREQDPGQGLHLVERDASSIVVWLLFRHSLSSVIDLRKAHFPCKHGFALTMNGHPPLCSAIRKPLVVQRFSMAYYRGSSQKCQVAYSGLKHPAALQLPDKLTRSYPGPALPSQ